MLNEKLKVNEQPSYAGTYELKDTASMMLSSDYKIRFVAEYVQLKIRYEKLKHLLTKWEAFSARFDRVKPCEECEEFEEEFTKWLGFKPSCNYNLLRDQQARMGMLLETLETRSIIEDIDLRLVTIKL